MKAQIKLALGLAVATLAVLIAAQSANTASITKLKQEHKIYSKEDVLLLTEANHWPIKRAVFVLELSANASTSTNTQTITPRDHE